MMIRPLMLRIHVNQWSSPTSSMSVATTAEKPDFLFVLRLKDGVFGRLQLESPAVDCRLEN